MCIFILKKPKHTGILDVSKSDRYRRMLKTAIDALRETPPNFPDYAGAIKRIINTKPPKTALVGSMDIGVCGSEGLRRLRQVNQYIKSIPVLMLELGNKELPLKQQQIADAFVASCVPTIVSVPEWVANSKLFIRELKLKNITMMGGVIAPRQTGKSWTIAICVASVMLVAGGVSIGIYASKIAQAEVIQDYVVQIFAAMKLPLKRSTKEHTVTFESGNGASSTITCFGFNA
jgi:hypothetical protein